VLCDISEISVFSIYLFFLVAVYTMIRMLIFSNDVLTFKYDHIC